MTTIKILFTTLIIFTSGCSTIKTEHLITINHNIRVTVAPETVGLLASMMPPSNTEIQESNATKTIKTIKDTKGSAH